jgi:hypothetical protein
VHEALLVTLSILSFTSVILSSSLRPASSIRQHTSAYVSIRQHTCSEYVCSSIRQHTPHTSAYAAYVSIRLSFTSVILSSSLRPASSIRQHTSACVSIRAASTYAAAYVNIRRIRQHMFIFHKRHLILVSPPCKHLFSRQYLYFRTKQVLFVRVCQQFYTSKQVLLYL